jgi:hypothetical protein
MLMIFLYWRQARFGYLPDRMAETSCPSRQRRWRQREQPWRMSIRSRAGKPLRLRFAGCRSAAGGRRVGRLHGLNILLLPCSAGCSLSTVAHPNPPLIGRYAWPDSPAPAGGRPGTGRPATRVSGSGGIGRNPVLRLGHAPRWADG